jgi:hypothetical protein
MKTNEPILSPKFALATMLHDSAEDCGGQPIMETEQDAVMARIQ